MAKTSTTRMTFPYAPDLVLSVLTDPEFIVANFKGQGNPDAKVHVRRKTDETIEIDADVTEYAKGVTGVDKSKTDLTHTHYRWNVKARKCEWTYESSHGSRVKIWGTSQVEPAGSGSIDTECFNADVSVPLVGGTIEKKVLKEVDAYWPKFERLVKEHCAKRA